MAEKVRGVLLGVLEVLAVGLLLLMTLTGMLILNVDIYLVQKNIYNKSS